MSAYLKSQNFCKHHGDLNGLIKFIELCSKEPDLEKIGERFDISSSQICRLRLGICENIWRPQKGTIEYIAFYIDWLKQQAQERGEYLKNEIEARKSAELHLIFAKDMGWIK